MPQVPVIQKDEGEFEKSLTALFAVNRYRAARWLMEDFRSNNDGWWGYLSEEERIELFLSMLTGSSDLNRKLLDRLCDNYSVDLTDVLNN